MSLDGDGAFLICVIFHMLALIAIQLSGFGDTAVTSLKVLSVFQLPSYLHTEHIPGFFCLAQKAMLSLYVNYTKIATNHIRAANDNICLSCGFFLISYCEIGCQIRSLFCF